MPASIGATIPCAVSDAQAPAKTMSAGFSVSTRATRWTTAVGSCSTTSPGVCRRVTSSAPSASASCRASEPTLSPASEITSTLTLSGSRLFSFSAICRERRSTASIVYSDSSKVSGPNRGRGATTGTGLARTMIRTSLGNASWGAVGRSEAGSAPQLSATAPAGSNERKPSCISGGKRPS